MNIIITRPLKNAKVMAREKQGESAEKLPLMGKKLLKSSLAIAVAFNSFAFLYSKDKYGENRT